MKLKRYLSITLAVLFLVVSLPVSNLLNASANNDEQAKINAIKSAWQNMQEKAFEIAPGSGKSNSVTAQYSSVTNTGLLPVEAQNDIPSEFGSVYTKVSVDSTVTQSTSKVIGTDYLKYGQSTQGIEELNVFLSFYIEKVNGNLSFVPFFREKGVTGADSGKLYTITSKDEGKWVTLTKEDIAGDYYVETSNLENSIILGINSSANNVIYLGSFIFTKNVSLPEGSESWNLKQWINAGNALDKSKYYNVDGLINALKEADPGSELLEELKNAWQCMQEKVLEINPVSASAKVTSFSIKVNNDLDKIIGSRYADITIGAISGNQVSGLNGNGNYIKYGNNIDVDVSKLNVYFSFYVDELKGELSFIPYFRVNNSGGGNTGKEYAVTAKDVGKWVTLSTGDIVSDTFSSVVTNLKNSIILGINASQPNTIKLGGYIFTKNASLPENTDDWSYVDWVNAASRIDVSNYINTEPFVKALQKASENNEEIKVTNNLRSAWKNITEKIAELNYSGCNGIIGTDYYYSVGSTEALPEAARKLPETASLGYATAVFKNTNSYSANSYGDAYLKTNQTTVNTKGSNPFLSFFVEESEYTEGLSFYIFFRQAGSAGLNTGKLYTVKPEDVGKWVTLDGNDLTPLGTVEANNLGNSAILSVYGTKEEGSRISFVSPYFTQNITMPEGSEMWGLAELVANARTLSLYGLFGTSEFLEALNQAEKYLKTNGIPVCGMESVPDDIVVLGENHLASITPDISYYNGSNSMPVTNESITYLTDGNINTAATLDNVTVGNGRYLDVTYGLGSYVDIEKILISVLNTDEMGSYEIYFGEEKDNIYNSQNCLLNASSDITQGSGQVLSLYSEINASYIGFRFTEAPINLNISELGIYGEKSDYKTEIGNFSNAKIQSIGKNILSLQRVDPKIRINGNKTANPSGYASSSLYDNNTSTGYAIPNAAWNEGEDESKYADIYFDLGSSYKINKLSISHWAELYLQSGAFEIYVSKTIGELFLASSSVLKYDNSSDSENGTTDSQLFSFAEGKEPIGRFVCFRIRCSVSDWQNAAKRYPGLLYVRITELGVYGEKYTPPAKPTNLLSHVPLSIYRTEGTNHIALDDKEITPEDVKKLYDGDRINDVLINTNGGELDFIFNLCGSMKLDEFNVYASEKQMVRLKVYAAETEDELWEETALAYDSGNMGIVSEFVKELKSQVSARFLRYSITVSGSVLNVTEFEAIGMDDQALIYRNLTLENDSAVSVYSMNYKTGFFRTVQQNENKLYARPMMYKSYMTDGDISSVFDIYSAKYGESSIDIVVDLGSLHSVDSIIMRAGSDSNHWPENMSVYVSENEDKVVSQKATPVYSFNKKAKDGVYAYESSPKYARYVRFQITKSIHPYINTYMLAVISEIEVNGLAVSGSIAEDVGAVLSFTDANTNIKVNIMQKDDNDVYGDVSGIDVKPYNYKLSEKKSLEPYSMMLYGNKYQIKLLDRNGKEVKDIGGRQITVFLPFTKDLDVTEAYVAYMDDGIATILETSVYEKRVSAVLNNPSELTLGVAGFVIQYPDGYFVDDEDEDYNNPSVVSTAVDNSIESHNTIEEIIEDDVTITDDNTGIKAVYSVGELPEGATLSVTRANKSVLPKVITKYLSSNQYIAYNIEFVAEGVSVEPNGMVQIVIPVPNSMTAENCKIYFFGSGITDMNAQIENGELSFYTDQSGVYMITDTDLSTISIVKNKSDGSIKPPYALIIGGALAGIVVIAGVILLIVLIKRRKKMY